MVGAKMKKQSKAKEINVLACPDIFETSAAKRKTIPVIIVQQEHFDSWIKKQSEIHRNFLHKQNFKAAENTVGIAYAADGSIDFIASGVKSKIHIYSLSATAEFIKKSSALNTELFEIETKNLRQEDLENACIGWALSCYQFTHYKKDNSTLPRLELPKSIDKNKVLATIQAISLIRNLINLPANDLGPEELANAAKLIAKEKNTSINIIEDENLILQNFPLIYAVGDGSQRRPRLIDMTWGNERHPKITIVGKGVCFDTGGYDLKPSAAMLMMKKDMGGAAMALGLAWMITSLKLPVRLRVLIPAVENSVSGHAYRPMDILQSRKGSTVEIHNTDAEGRLVMADCLTLACEEKPDLVIDFSTLTGAARTALGYDIPALFSNNDKIAEEIKKIGIDIKDPLWPMPLWDGYRGEMFSHNADMNNTGTSPAGAITAALFLEHFIENNVNWIHIDHYAWEQHGRPGRPKGGTDMGMRAILAYIQKKYVTDKRKK